MGEVVIMDPREDPIERILSLLVRNGLDYSANLVVFPGKRPGHYLRRAIGREVRVPYRPPVILPMDSFMDLLCEGLLDHRPIEAIDAVAIIYDLCRDMDFLPQDFKRFDYFYSLGMRLFRALEELYIEEVPPERLREVEALIEIPVRSVEGVRFLSSLYKRFYRRLKEEGLSTRSMRYRAASEGFDPGRVAGYERVVLAGFFAFTAAEKRLAKKLLGIERVFFFFRRGRGLGEVLRDLGIGDGGTEDHIPWKGRVHIYSAPDTHGEVYGAGRVVKGLEGLNEDTVIVLPQGETLFPLVRQGLPFLGEKDYNISMGYPIVRTPIYGFFTGLFDLISSMEGESLHIPHYLKFMLHPYTKNILYRGRADITRMILHTMEGLFREGSSAFAELSWIEENVPTRIAERLKGSGPPPEEIGRHLYEIHSNTIRRFLDFDDIGDFASRCKALLLYIYNHSTARLHPLFFPFVEAFIRELDRLSHSLIRGLSFDERESYFHFFRRYILPATVPFEGTPLKGLQILGFLETRSIRFRRVLFLDLNEGIFPNLSEDYLIPLQVRRTLGLPTPEERERFLSYYFDLLLKGAEEVHLFYVKDGKMERSRFLERLLWEMEKERGEPFKDEGPVTPITYRVSLSNKRPQAIPKSEGVLTLLQNLVLSPSSLDEYLRCGLRFYYSSLLRLKDTRGWELDRTGIGEVVHEALRDYFVPRLGKTLTGRDLVPGEMRRIVTRIFSERYGRNLSGRLYLIKVQVERRLLEVLEYYRKLLEKVPVTVLSVEEDLGPQDLEGASFRCRLDMVEQRGREIYIIDYKTSGGDGHLRIDFNKLDPGRRETWPRAIGSLQIPLYLMLYSEGKGVPLERLKGGYLLLGKASLDGEFFPLGDEEVSDRLHLLSTLIRRLVEEMRDQDLPFSPPIDLKASCPPCDYRGICGTEWVAGKSSKA